MKNRTHIASEVRATYPSQSSSGTGAAKFPVSRQALLVILLGGSLAASAWSSQALAAGSRYAVEAEPGEIVLLRTVPTRSATRQAPPARAILVDPKPNGELQQGLAPLTDEDYGLVSAGVGSSGTGLASAGGVVSDGVRQALGGASGSTRDGKPAPASSVGGAVTSVTGGIAGQVNGALSSTGLMGRGGQQ
ncbi:hypothetical protein [Guyparkeria sp.]|uniref:hypothetical protein n=1 Tax=Guyparkeria sp. TaxID=2035736 RepID=UPI0039704BFB